MASSTLLPGSEWQQPAVGLVRAGFCQIFALSSCLFVDSMAAQERVVVTQDIRSAELPVEARCQIEFDQLGTASEVAWARSDRGSQAVGHAVCTRHIREADKLGHLHLG